MKKKLLSQKRLSQFMYSIGLFLLCVNLGWGQTPPSGTDSAQNGDYRSLVTGNWNNAATWQTRSGGSWATATIPPTATNTVYIQAGHTVTLTSDASCYSLHMERTAVLAADVYAVNINGKLRCFIKTPAVTDATDSSYTGADGMGGATGFTGPPSTLLIFGTPLTTTLRFVGTQRSLTFSNEWSSSTAIAIPGEFALNSGQLGTLGIGVCFRPAVVASGNYTTNATMSFGSLGDFTIKNGAKFTTGKTGFGSASGALGANNSGPAGKLEIEEGGTLEYTSATPSANFNSFVNNGTVIFNFAGATEFISNNNGTISTGAKGSADLSVYNNVILAGTATVMAAPTTTKSIKGVLTIADGCTLNTGGLVVLKSTAAKTATIAPIGTGVINGVVTVERYIPATQRAYRLLSPATSGGTINSNWQEGGLVTSVGGISDPIPGFGTHLTGASGSTNGFDTTTNNAASIFTYNSITPAWNALANTSGTVAAGDPYLVYVRGSRQASNISTSATNDATTLRTTGTLVTGTVNVTAINPSLNAFTALGNPYQAQVDMQKVLVTNATAVNLAPFYYFVDPSMGTKGSYVTVDLSNPGAYQYLQPGQAFFVNTVSPGAASLQFTENDKSEVAAQTAVFKTKKEATSNLGLTLMDGTSKRLDVLRIAFDANETNVVNQNDAAKLTNFDENMAASNDGKLLAIEKRAIPTESDIIPLNITKYRGTSYKIKAEGSGLTGPTAYILDSFTGTTTEIPQDGSVEYAYTVDTAIPASAAASRISIVYAKTLKVNTNALSSFALYPNPSKSNSFNVVVPQSSSNVSLSVSNLLGQQLYSQKDLQSGATIITVPNANTGVYLVSLTSEGKTATTKWIVE